MIFVKTKDIQLSPKGYEKIANETSSRKDAIFKVTDELARCLTNYFNDTNKLITFIDEDSEIIDKIVNKLKLDREKVYSIIKVSLPLFNNLFNEIIDEKENKDVKTNETNKINTSTSDGYYSRIDAYKDVYKYTKDNNDTEKQETVSYPKVTIEDRIEDLIDDKGFAPYEKHDDIKPIFVEDCNFNNNVDPLSLIEPVQEYKDIKEIEEPQEEKEVYHKPAKALVLEEIKLDNDENAKKDIIQDTKEELNKESTIDAYFESITETYNENIEKSRTIAINELKTDNVKAFEEVKNTTSNELINSANEESNNVVIVQNELQKGYFRVFSIKDFIDSKSSKTTRSVLTGLYTLVGILVVLGLISSIIVAIYFLFVL